MKNILKLIILLFKLYSILLKNCGVRKIERPVLRNKYLRIINGEEALDHSWPWMVSLRIIQNDSELLHFCGGTLIDTDLVITAAHCMNGKDANSFLIVAGSPDMSVKPRKTQLFPPAKFKTHEFYSRNSITKGYDIALIKLKYPVKLSSKVAVICLPKLNDSYLSYNTEVLTIGWGIHLENSLSVPNKLQQTKLKIINGDCRCSLKSSYDSDKLFCALDIHRNSTVCNGDSGGPLMHYKNGKWYLFGLASYIYFNYLGIYCDNLYPSFYTKLSSYLINLNGKEELYFPGDWQLPNKENKNLIEIYLANLNTEIVNKSKKYYSTFSIPSHVNELIVNFEKLTRIILIIFFLSFLIGILLLNKI